MEPPFSTLELLKHDETARAPERDHDATAFELDASALAPQVVPDTTPQVSYDSSLPEAHSQPEDSNKERASSDYITKAALKWPWMVVALVVAAAMAIGVGVGIWRHHTTISQTPSQNHTIAPTGQFILNDTSLAALILSNGDRHLFFQDKTGLIRHVFRTASNEQWSTTPSVYFHSNYSRDWPNPKNNTPLAVAVYEEVSEGSLIELFYVSDSHQLQSLFTPNSVIFSIQDSGKNYSTAVDTRSLSVTLFSRPVIDPEGYTDQTLGLLYYENSSGNISALLLRGNITSDGDYSQWFDISSQSSQSLPDGFGFPNNESFPHTLDECYPDSTFGPPFTTNMNTTMLYTPTVPYLSGTPGIIACDYDFDSGLFKFRLAYPIDSRIRLSDIAAVGQDNFIWINGTQPVTTLGSPPNTTFPFARLASFDSADELSTYLYHQINGTTFAEEQWDVDSNTWLPSVYFTVSGLYET